MTFSVRQLIFILSLLLPHWALAAVDSAYLSELQARAKQLHLAERPEWRKLLHYQPRMIVSGYRGQVDSPAFYLAANGKTEPQAELDATLASFFSDTLETDTVQNPQCAFIARYQWLHAQLHFDAARLTPRICKRYQQWHAALNPEHFTLIFASAYLNSPSSMYDHTFLRVDARDQNEQTRLLAYAVNFAANTNETNGLAFAVNGLFGGYAGAFSMLPYYTKVREYSDFESRDLWEYRLNLSSEEIERVLQHAWELGPNYFDYYFFDENCSYHLLGLLQVARPEFDFTTRFRWGVIPADTVRAITSYPGLVHEVVYRPATATILRYRLAQMDDADKASVSALSSGRISADAPALQALPLARYAAVLEAGLDYADHREAAGKHDVADAAKLLREIRTARSHLDIISAPVVPPEPEVKPDQGHASSRYILAAGRRATQNFQELQVRATYHDLLDAEAGYIRGAQIDFFNTTLRHYEGAATRLERFTPVDILSLSPRDDFFQPWSWKVAGGWERVSVAHGNEPLVGVLEGGMGGAWSGAHALSYLLLDASTRVNSALVRGYAYGMGGSAGSYLDATPAWRIHPYGRAIRYFAGQQDSLLTLGVQQRVVLAKDMAVRADVARERQLRVWRDTISASLMVYF